MKRGKCTFQSQPKERKKIQTFARRFVTICWILCPIVWAVSLLMHAFATATLLFIMLSLFFLIQGSVFSFFGNKELCIYENGILIPYGLGRKFFFFSAISQIKLNTARECFTPEIEIILRNGEVKKYKKTLIHNWKDFYKTMLFKIADKVKIVE